MAACGLLGEIPAPGFSFENCKRNAHLQANGVPLPKATKTGTTISGCIFKDGVVLGADCRATSGNIVADKNCSKIHYMAPNMYCCGAGTAADTEYVTNMMASQLELHRLATGRQSRVITANKLLAQLLFRYQGHIGAHLVLGGVDVTGPHIYTLHAHGSSETLPYVSMGSGSLAAIAVLETGWKPDMTMEEAKKLVKDSIVSGIYNDMGSGQQVDLCVITRDRVDYLRPYELTCRKGQRQKNYRFNAGATPILSQKVVPIEVEESIVRQIGSAESMETA